MLGAGLAEVQSSAARPLGQRRGWNKDLEERRPQRCRHTGCHVYCDHLGEEFTNLLETIHSHLPGAILQVLNE